MRYEIRNAVSSAGGNPGKPGLESSDAAAPDWGQVYFERHALSSESDEEALAEAEALQERHDSEYLILCGGEPEGWDRAPCYPDCVFAVGGDGSERKVES